MTFLKKVYEENFIVTVKDRQKIGTTESEDGKQPKSSFKVGSVNYESCYDTKSKKGNSTGRNNIYFCNQGVDGGEMIPAQELYSFDFSNYTIHPAKNLRGERLNGSFRVYNGNTYDFNDGIMNGEKLTLAQSKNICDSLQEECHGFIISIPNKLNPNNTKTIFISKKEVGWEDPNTYVKNEKYDDTNTNIISYVKKDLRATEKNIPQDKINQISNKYINQKQKLNITPIPNNTSNMVGYRGQFQKIFSINITGNAQSGAVWGSDTYTDDSEIRRAAVHAGIVKNGENKTVYIEMVPAQRSYSSTNRNGVSTSSYGPWAGSYKFVQPNNDE